MVASYEEVRNAKGKLICKIDCQNKIVQIVSKGMETQIIFNENGSVHVKSNQLPA